MKIEWIKKIWKDSVGSKLIAAGLIFIISLIAIFFWGLITKLNFFGIYKKIFDLLKTDFLIKGWLLLILIFILLSTVLFLIRTIKKKIKDSPKVSEKVQEFKEPEKTEIREASTVFFHYRFCDAFPGFSSSYKWFTSKRDIRNRLKILLANPLAFDLGEGYGIDIRPIWWFRGSCAIPIEKFEILNRKKVLLYIDELIIDKIAAYRGQSYYEDFVYVQCLPDRPTGLYNHNQQYIESCINEDREYQEEFGVFNNRFISRQEYDDGSAIIKGKPVRTIGAELRSRTLTKYNFIIAAKFSPYNCQDFYRNSHEYFGKLLRNEIVFDDFINWIKKFPKNHND